jgi:RNA polymerase sigma factor (sigma-70 family)
MDLVARFHCHMQDSEIVAAIVAGDPDGLAEAYDKYASPLFTYCRSLLREPADAADAVQDTFVIAASKLAGLRDQSRLRPWLYAVARNECRRRLRESTSEAPAALEAVPDVTDESVDVTGGAERAELRTLLRSAVRGLNAGEQDLIELQLRQELDVAEIASVLGVSRNHAHALLSRARDQLEISLGALLVARSGRADCTALSALLEDWDGQLNVLMRKRINRHIERCPACAERKRRELAPALLLGLAPLAALPLAPVPAGLRAQVLKLVSSNTPEAITHRASIAARTAPFTQHGFPKPLDPPKPRWRTRKSQAAAAAAALVAAAAVLIILALISAGPAHGSRPAALGQATSLGGGTGTPAGPASGTVAPGSQRQPTGPASTGPAGGAAHVSPSPGSGGTPLPAAVSSAPATGPASSATAPSSGHSTPPASPAPPTSSATATSTASSTPSATPTPPAPAQGTLSVTPTTIALGPTAGGALTLRASGGPVSWSATVSASLAGELTVAPSAGRLAAGQSVTVALGVIETASLDSQLVASVSGDPASIVPDVSCNGKTVTGELTVTPGGHRVAVQLSTGTCGCPSPSPSPSPSQSTGNPDDSSMLASLVSPAGVRASEGRLVD